MRPAPTSPLSSRSAPPSVLRWSWVVALVAALIVLGLDTAGRLEVVRRATEGVVGADLRPVADATSPTGFRWGEHRLVLPQTDGYQWLLQAEQERVSGETRVRSVRYDDEAGREVHWAGFIRWWGLGMARVDRLLHAELSPAAALERAASWANPALLALLLVVLTPLLAVRLGTVEASLFALGSVGIQSFVVYFSAGFFDHHGVVAMAGALVVIFLAVAVEGDGAPRRWAIASGLAGAFGLWISAASMAPILASVGLGAALAFATPSARPADRSARMTPDLFRVWGIAGAVGSFAFYLLEYFPGHLGMRLEVNHPLYALAFFGGGDLIARFGRATGRRQETGEPASPPLPWAPLVADLVLVLAIPFAVLLAGKSVFLLRDPFLWRIHGTISEFQPLLAWIKTRTPSQSAAELSLAPILALPVAAALWPTEGARDPRWIQRGALVAAMLVTGVYLLFYLGAVTRGSLPIAIGGAAALLGIAFGLPVTLPRPALEDPARAVLWMALIPAVAALAQSFLQLRWLSSASGLWLAALVVLSHALVRTRHPQVATPRGLAVSGAVTAAVVALGATLYLRQPMDTPSGDMVVRDASYWLRHRVGGKRTVVLASSGITTSMIWFGGFQGIGSLYWENLDGLRAATELYAAADPDSVRALLARRGVTHVAFVMWNAGLTSAEEAAHAADGTSGRGLLSGIEQGAREGRLDSLPTWLSPLPYEPATVAGYPHPVVHLFEVVPDQTPEIAWARVAQFHHAVKNAEGMDAALARSLAIAPNVPALALKAQIERAEGHATEFGAALSSLRAELAKDPTLRADDRMEAVLALGLGGDQAGVTTQVERVLAESDEAALRLLGADPLSLLIELGQRLGLEGRYGERLALARALASELPAP